MKLRIVSRLTLISLAMLSMAQVASAGPIEDVRDAISRNDYVMAERLSRPLAALGNAEAQFYLGNMHDLGLGAPHDYQKAVNWYRRSAEQGYAKAQWYLAAMYQAGQGVPQDFREAVKWYLLSAKQGNPQAQWHLGLIYSMGWGAPLDFVRAHMWYNLSAATNESAVKSRDDLAATMTPSQISRAQAMASKCHASNFKNCD